MREGVIYDRPLDSTRSGADPGLDAGIFSLAIARKTDSGAFVAYAASRSQTGAVQQLSARSEEAGHRQYCDAATSATEFFAKPCCVRLSTTISSFQRNVRLSKKSWPISALFRRSNSTTGSRNSRKLIFLLRLENFDWVDSPAQFVEQLSAYLWTTHQLDAFRKAATDYGDRLQEACRRSTCVPRLGNYGRSARVSRRTTNNLFRKLRAHGAYFKNVKPDNGLSTLLRRCCSEGQSTFRCLWALVYRWRTRSLSTILR